jgi:hypothetical protein
MSILSNLENKVKIIEGRLADQYYQMEGLVASIFKRIDEIPIYKNAKNAIYTAIVVDTIDPRKQGRVRFFNPFLHEPGEDITAYPFAAPISPFGGFDDCGAVWVPPAGSTIMIAFETGFVRKPFYFGTIWPRNRGPENAKAWEASEDGFEIPEYNEIHQGHRKGYLLGPGDSPNDESQVLPPWNTENYNSIDTTSLNEFLTDTERKQISYPHIMGFKSQQKHMMKWDDGDAKCNHRYKRMEWQSSLGNWMIFKDDFMHPGGQWAHPNCCGQEEGEADCVDADGNPVEQVESCTDKVVNEGICKNKFFKHKNECRPYTGPQTPQNNKCDLPQSGIQVLSLSGHTMILDDSVDDPIGIPEWERSLEPFGFGCKNTYLGKMSFKSATGHLLELNDEEYQPNPSLSSFPDGKRGGRAPTEGFDPWDNGDLPLFINEKLEMQKRERPARNGILLLTATGNRIELNDETLPGDTAGMNRGITMQSTSNHTLEMIDYTNEQFMERKEGGQPTPKAKNGYVRIRTGYGLMMEMMDNFSQDTTQSQYVRLVAPQKDSPCGHHEIRLQENSANTGGQITVRSGGDYVRQTLAHDKTVVGDDEGCIKPSNKLTQVVNGKYVVDVPKGYYYNHADQHIFFAEKYILLFAGRDCPPPPEVPEEKDQPCAYPVLVGRCLQRCPVFTNMLHITEKSLSERVFASAKRPDECTGQDIVERFNPRLTR